MSGRRSKRRSSWGRRRRKSRDPDTDDDTRESSYIPPSPTSGASSPKERSLTSGLSTLFRRSADGQQRQQGASLDSIESSIASTTYEDDTPRHLEHVHHHVAAAAPRASSRLFYSDTGQDDSDEDSYESRISKSQADDDDDGDDDDLSVTSTMMEPKTIVRYRGFSTSLSSLFLDEPLVCASMGCFGLLLSNRTEYLLSVRQEKRGMRKTRKVGNPSKIMAYTLLLTLILIASTFCIWGFGNGKNDAVLQDYYDGYDDNDDAYNNGNDDGNNQNDDQNRRDLSSCAHTLNGVFKVRDYHEHLWQPVLSFLKEEWYRNDDEATRDRSLEQQYQNDDAYNANNNNYNDDSQEESNGRNAGADTRMALFLAFLVFLGIVGRKRRMRTRYALIRARAQEDHLYYASASQVTLHNTREDQFDGACSHTLCGCYPIDPAVDVPEEDVLEYRGKQKQKKHGDCVSRGFNMFLNCCCGVICKCWFQCLSVCSLAQEGREMRLLLPPRFQRIDYITHQPFSDYQKDVNDLRRGWLGKTRRKAGLMPHFYALSRLSRYILLGFTGVLTVILLTLLINPRASFSLPDAIVLLATFGQSFIVLYVVHWIFHKSDLSLDAVIKFFATGFLIATPTAFFFEGLIVNCILVVSYSFYSLLVWIQGDAFVNFVITYWRFIWIIGELINAYLVAAVTEELCKYYSFRAVEHPDLIFLTGLDREANDNSAVDGGHIKYTFSSHQVSKLNRANSFGSVSSHRSSSSRVPELPGILRTTTEEEFYEDENDARTYRQKAAAVTTGMIGVAVGLACAENFLYVFVLGGAQESEDGRSGGVLEEWVVLLFRSVFPIHALAAAMQSVNMVRKFVECTDDNSHRIGVGRIILPAVLLHGSFDAILLSINVFIESSWDKYLEENQGNAGDGVPYNALVVNLVAWASILCVMLLGVLWYYRENRAQRLRLILLEERDRAREEGGNAAASIYGPSSSTQTGGSEVELV